MLLCFPIIQPISLGLQVVSTKNSLGRLVAFSYSIWALNSSSLSAIHSMGWFSMPYFGVWFTSFLNSPTNHIRWHRKWWLTYILTSTYHFCRFQFKRALTWGVKGASYSRRLQVTLWHQEFLLESARFSWVEATLMPETKPVAINSQSNACKFEWL